MGKRILVRRRGKGNIQYRAPRKGKIGAVRYPFTTSGEIRVGEVTNIVNERGRGTPLAQVRFKGDSYIYLPAVEGVTIGSKIEVGSNAAPLLGNVLPIGKIPEGSTISNIERNVGDGGKLVKAAGVSAILFSHTPDGTIVKMPSGAPLLFNDRCRATMGVISGGGRYEKPFLKAGTKRYAMKARGKLGSWPRVRGIAMAAVHHPHGGGRHQHVGKSSSVARNTPAGRKVGIIAPRKTGRKRIHKKFKAVVH